MDGGSSLRVVRPQRRYIPYKQEQDEDKSQVLAKIDAAYKEACIRIDAGKRHITLARLYEAGVCIGLLDPISNILINTLATGRLREALKAEASAGAVDPERLQKMEQLSFDALKAFLICFFPYLAGWEAVRYLRLGEADLLVTARLIVADRGLGGFSITSTASACAFKAALSVAAQITGHPRPEQLVRVWITMSAHLDQTLLLLKAVKPHAPRRSLSELKTLLDNTDAHLPVLDLRRLWDLADYRPSHYGKIANMPYQHTRSLRMVLLDTIRSFYLRALARLPRSELRSRYHRSLLMGGHCYGPLDPVCNIIINTIWYDVNFPAADPPVLDLIGPNSLTRLESRSFYGLASFLQTRYHNLSEHEIVQYLITNYARLNIDAEAQQEEHQQYQHNLDFLHPSSWHGFYDAVRKAAEQTPCGTFQEAYEAAATAAWHPKPVEQAKFLSFCKTILQGPALLLLQNGARLSSDDVQHIAGLLSPKEEPVPERTKRSTYPTVAGKKRSEAQQRRITRWVEAALDTHALQDGEPMYDLHIICGVNELVCGPEFCNDRDDDLSFAPCKFFYSHVNFLATQRDSQSAERDPVLFFAEFDNEDDGKLLKCCRVDMPLPYTEHVRCLYCESEGAKVVHPAMEKFHGGDQAFEEMICRGDNLANERLICKSEYAVQRMCGVEEDFMYVDVT